MFSRPLLQRASTVVRATQSKLVTLDIRLLPELPFGFSGSAREDVDHAPLNVDAIFQEYSQKKPIVVDVDGCPVGTVGYLLPFTIRC